MEKDLYFSSAAMIAGCQIQTYTRTHTYIPRCKQVAIHHQPTTQECTSSLRSSVLMVTDCMLLRALHVYLSHKPNKDQLQLPFHHIKN